MAITIGNSTYTYLRDAINAAINNNSIMIGAGTYNILDYTIGLPQNANNYYCGPYANSLSRFFSSPGGISGLSMVGAGDVTASPTTTINNLTRIYAGAKDRGFGVPSTWTIQNLNLQFNVTSGSEYILQGGNYGSTTNNLANLTLRNVRFLGTHVGNSGSNGAYTDLKAATNLVVDKIRVGSDFGGQQTYSAGSTTTLSSGGSAFLFAQGSGMLVENSNFVESRYGNTITFWGSSNATISANIFDGDGQLKQRGQILSNSTGTVDSNAFVGGTHLDLIDINGQILKTTNNKFDSLSINSATTRVSKGVGIAISSTTTDQSLDQARNLNISGNQFEDVIPIVVQLSGSSTGPAGASPQLSYGPNDVFNTVTQSFTTFGRFLIGGTSNDILNGASSTIFDDFISGAEGNDTLTGNGGNDAFVFAFQPGTANNNVDTITDFRASGKGIDTIWLDDAVFTTLSKGALGSAFGTKINYNATTKGLFYDPTGSGSTTETPPGTAFKIATFSGLSIAPVATDFVVF